MLHRYLGRDEVAQASLNKAQEEGGSVRVVTRDNFFKKPVKKSASSLTPPAPEKNDHRQLLQMKG